MRLYPDSAPVQLEFNKVIQLLKDHIRTEWAATALDNLRIHTRKEFIDRDLGQAAAYLDILQTGTWFPEGFVLNASRSLQLLSIPGAVLQIDEFRMIRSLAEYIQQLFRWFRTERREQYPDLFAIIATSRYEAGILAAIEGVIDPQGEIRDQASDELAAIRSSLHRKRGELRRIFDRSVQKLVRAGYIADIEESFLNGRRVVAVMAEHKRMVRGILHGESDTRRTAFVEPEETIELNNDVFSLENEERKEIQRILRQLTAEVSIHAPLLTDYHVFAGTFDLIRAKAMLARDMEAVRPSIQNRSGTLLIRAYHPLLLRYNRNAGKTVVPLDLKLDDQHRMLVISGPNAGGKTVAMKTLGLLQLMVQSGLLVPVSPDSVFGIFQQLMIHIGDTQSLEFELSTYSAHLRNMKYFMESANGRTLFFIDELGSGTDPNLGGAFAEVFLEELSRRHAYGIVTTHYLNLKVMANKTAGIINGAMAFDEKNLQPLYHLQVGKPGSSYTFSIAERIGMDPQLIARAQKIADDHHIRLDKLLNKTEQDLRLIQAKEKELQALLKKNETLRKEMEKLMDREKHQQQVTLLKEQNRVSEEKFKYLKDMERKLKQIVFDWRKAAGDDEKRAFMKQLQALLFQQKEKQVREKKLGRLADRFEETTDEPAPGLRVWMKKSNQVGILQEIRSRKAVVLLGSIPMTVDLQDLVVVREKQPLDNS